jgi:hypothetical protein
MHDTIEDHLHVDRRKFDEVIAPAGRPAVIRGLVDDWPFVRAARESRTALARAIQALDAGHEPYVIEAPPDVNGRIFYRDDLTAFNFTRRPATIRSTVDRLLELGDSPSAPAIFLESTSAKDYMPGFAGAHPMPLLDERVEPRIWIGNAIKVNTHFDLAYNIACVVGGRGVSRCSRPSRS